MSADAMVAAVIGTVMVLMLNWRALRNHALSRTQMLRMALIWGAVIAVLTVLISQVMV